MPKEKFRENGNYSCSDLCNSCYFSYCSCDEGIKRKLSTHYERQTKTHIPAVAGYAFLLYKDFSLTIFD